jgi:hypothetical protein
MLDEFLKGKDPQPQLVKKDRRRLTGCDEMVIALYRC